MRYAAVSSRRREKRRINVQLEFKVFVRELKELLKVNKNQLIEQAIRYQDDDKRITIPVAHFKKGELKRLADILEESIRKYPNEKRVRDNKWTKNRIWEYFSLHEGHVDDQVSIKTVEALLIALKRFVEINAPHRWLFTENQDHIMLPYFVTNIDYHKRQRHRDGGVTPASVTLSAEAYRQGSKRSVSAHWAENDFRPMTVVQALMDEDLMVETPIAVETYLKQLEEYGQYQSACGKQVYGIGDAFGIGGSNWYRSYSMVPLVRNGEPTRLVLDPLSEEVNEKSGVRTDATRVYHSQFWDDIPDRNGLTDAPIELEPNEEEDEAPEPGVSVMLPLHPYLYAFDLDKHQWLNVHIANIQPYPWDKLLISKLILPQDQKDLLEVLMSTTGSNVGDIVRGKMSGIIVLATGVPGVGKTLTAEVFSEFIEKPLYSVQCSQLGLDVSSIESELQTVLNRAGRWGAVLLIDEADVYVRERGEDIQQNAIVGVFLRLLEYYRGVLFMTSNRDIIDDAILSRATAWIKYRLPDDSLLRQIWHVLASQYKVKLNGADIDKLVEKLPSISGRSVRNILKLAVLLRGSKAAVSDLLRMSGYQALEKRK
jgi:hypothetical protein